MACVLTRHLLTDIRAQVFAVLGFPLEGLSQGAQKAGELALQPPPIDPDTPEGAISRKKLLRAWVELSAWLVIFEKNSEFLGAVRFSQSLNTVQRRRSSRTTAWFFMRRSIVFVICTRWVLARTSRNVRLSSLRGVRT